jgi:hypothetical protein
VVNMLVSLRFVLLLLEWILYCRKNRARQGE